MANITHSRDRSRPMKYILVKGDVTEVNPFAIILAIPWSSMDLVERSDKSQCLSQGGLYARTCTAS